MEHNQQLSENIVHANEIDVIDIYTTIQGEGPFAGQPCVFLRLAGCNLQCPKCDTDYTSNRHLKNPEQIINNINKIHTTTNLVVITGGEPFRQHLEPLIVLLYEQSYDIQIETNGTIYPGPNFPFQLVTIVCSPKTTLNNKIIPHIHCYKYILKAGDVAKNGLPLHALTYSVPVPHPPQDHKQNIFLQPLDEEDEVSNLNNLKATVDSCLEHGYTLSLQLQKYIGLS